MLYRFLHKFFSDAEVLSKFPKQYLTVGRLDYGQKFIRWY